MKNILQKSKSKSEFVCSAITFRVEKAFLLPPPFLHSGFSKWHTHLKIRDAVFNTAEFTYLVTIFSGESSSIIQGNWYRSSVVPSESLLA